MPSQRPLPPNIALGHVETYRSRRPSVVVPVVPQYYYTCCTFSPVSWRSPKPGVAAVGACCK